MCVCVRVCAHVTVHVCVSELFLTCIMLVELVSGEQLKHTHLLSVLFLFVHLHVCEQTHAWNNVCAGVASWCNLTR